VVAGLLLGWSPVAAVLLGGVTYISSSGIIAKLLTELGGSEKPESAIVVSVLVLEDLGMAVFLPLMSVILIGGRSTRLLFSVSIAILIVAVVLVAAIRYGKILSKVASHASDEIVLLTMFGTVLVVAGVAQRFQVSAAIGAFLVGIAASGPLAKQTHRLLSPLRDLFAATFFFFFGLEVDPGSLIPAIPVAVVLAIVTSATKVVTGYWSASQAGIGKPGRWRAGVMLIPRGEFSIVIAGLGIAAEPRLGPISAAYVLLLAFAGPILLRLIK
jgi:CPA2 family monovalent cation:H+ antiporter-2